MIKYFIKSDPISISVDDPHSETPQSFTFNTSQPLLTGKILSIHLVGNYNTDLVLSVTL